jgi:hypothetical protein
MDEYDICLQVREPLVHLTINSWACKLLVARVCWGKCSLISPKIIRNLYSVQDFVVGLLQIKWYIHSPITIIARQLCVIFLIFFLTVFVS